MLAANGITSIVHQMIGSYSNGAFKLYGTDESGRKDLHLYNFPSVYGQLQIATTVYDTAPLLFFIGIFEQFE